MAARRIAIYRRGRSSTRFRVQRAPGKAPRGPWAGLVQDPGAQVLRETSGPRHRWTWIAGGDIWPGRARIPCPVTVASWAMPPPSAGAPRPYPASRRARPRLATGHTGAGGRRRSSWTRRASHRPRAGGHPARRAGTGAGRVPWPSPPARCASPKARPGSLRGPVGRGGRRLAASARQAPSAARPAQRRHGQRALAA